MGMDRQIKKKKWPPRKIAMYASALLFVLVVLYLFLFKLNKSSLNVQKERLTISTVERAPFQEFIPVMGIVEPIDQYFLEAVEGGVVSEIYLEAGQTITKGEKILKLENTDLLMTIMWREAELFQTQNNLRQTRLSMEQQRLRLNQDLAQVESQLQQSKRIYERYAALLEDNLIARHDYDIAKDGYDYSVRRKELTLESMKNDLEFRQNQIENLEENLDRMQSNMRLVKLKQENLIIKAPISGHLTALDAEIGQMKRPGTRFGQIDVLDRFSVRVGIDEHWISRVEEGRLGTFEYANNSYELRVRRKYMEVTEGRFEVDMDFLGDVQAAGLTRGMTLHIRLNLGELTEAIVLPRGGFFQTTGGNWVYIVDADETFAVKRRIRTNRYNTQVYEVTEGLEPGEKVITSSYESFGDMERLILK